MKKFFTLAFSICATIIWAQSATITGPRSVEVGVNNNYTFTYQSAPSGQTNTKYRITLIQIGCSTGSINNLNQNFYNDNTQINNEITTGTNKSFTIPIRWADGSNSTLDGISFSLQIQSFNPQTNIWSSALTTTYTETRNGIPFSDYKVDIERVFAPEISTPVVQACCPTNVQFTATQFGTGNTFNWNNFANCNIVSGQGTAVIIVAPTASPDAISFDLTVGRGQNLGYTKSTTKFIQKVPRTATYTFSAPAIFTYGAQEYICKSAGRTFSSAPQCGLQGITWTAPNCTITGQGTTSALIIPNASIPNGTAIDIYGIANFDGGCTIQMPATNFRVFDTGTTTAPLGGNVVVSSFPANVPLQNASHWNFNYQMKKGTSINYSNSIFTFNPDGANITSYDRTITVSACSLNVCNGNTSCQDYQVFLPGVANWQPYRLAVNLSTTDDIQQEQGTNEFQIYPNPNNGEFIINLQNVTSGNYQILDSNSGVLLDEQRFLNQSELKINLLSAIKSGLYLVKVSTEKGIFTSKLILNK